MVKINWDEYKEYKLHTHKQENFEILIDFMKSYYNINNPADIFESLQVDGLAQMMLEKHNIKDDEDLENYMFQRR